MFYHFISTTVLILLFCCITDNAIAQDTLVISKSENFMPRRQVCLNLSPLAMQFVPFNRSDPRLIGPYITRFKWAGTNRKSAFRISLGLNIDASDDNERNQYFNFGLGWDRRRNINKKWSHTRGMEFVLWAGNRNIPAQLNNNNFGVLLGVAPLWGIEYALSRHVTLGTEAQMVLATDLDNGPVITIIPPVGLFLHYYFK
jgi:hypothetical protein